MIKKDLRKLYRQKRKQLSVASKEKLDDLLLIQFQKMQLPFLQTILSYWPIDDLHEMNTHLITRYLGFKNPGLLVCFPVADFETHEMTCVYPDPESDFSVNTYGIMEPTAGEEIDPADLDAVIIPLLAFDRYGYRVGYGKGFYDRFLARCNKDILKFGFSYFAPEERIDDVGENDIKLSCCITPERIYEFSN